MKYSTRLFTLEDYDQNPPKETTISITKHKNQLKILTYNVKTLLSYAHLLELEKCLSYINYDIKGIYEVRRQGCEIKEHENFILCYIGKTTGKYGVGFIINKEIKKNIESCIGKSERLAILNIDIGGHKISILQL